MKEPGSMYAGVRFSLRQGDGVTFFFSDPCGSEQVTACTQALICMLMYACLRVSMHGNVRRGVLMWNRCPCY